MLPNLFHPFTGDPVEAGAPLSQAGERCPPLQFTSTHTHEKTNGILGNLSKL